MSEESGDQDQRSDVLKDNYETLNSDKRKIEENPPEDLLCQDQILEGEANISKTCNYSGDPGETKVGEKDQNVEPKGSKQKIKLEKGQENVDLLEEFQNQGQRSDSILPPENLEGKSLKVQGQTKGVDEDQGSRADSRKTKSEKRWQQAVEDYCQFLEHIWENYRFGLIMQTSLMLVLIVGWTVVWDPVRDGIYYQILNYPKPVELDPNQVVHFMEQHKQNSECDLTELQERYTKLQRNYSSLEEDMLTLQENYTKLHETLVKHEKQITNTSTSLESIGVNVTDFKGKLQQQSEQTHRVQKDIDSTMLKQISEGIWQYLWILVAIGEIVLIWYVISLKSLLGNRGRQPQALEQPVDRPETNRDRQSNQPRSVLNGAFKTSTENSVCVLSFNGDPAHRKHVQLSKSFLGEKVKVTDVVIHREGDIPNIPPSKIVLVHVDFNARNIILENPDREIGELRRTTVQALWRMNADVILFYYYEERNAKPLGDQDLYSSDLVSVRTQAELIRLEGQKRFISLNGQLSERQRQHLSEVVQAIIG